MISIKLLNGPAFWMTHYAESDGSVYLDLSDNTSVALSKEIEQQTSINKINIEAVLGTSLPLTPKNEVLIGKAAELAINNNTYADFDVDVSCGLKTLIQGTLRVKSKTESETGSKYEIELLDTTNHWALLLNKTYLDELPFATFDYSPQKLWDSIVLDARYDDGDAGYWFPLVNYGSFFGDEKFEAFDFRPLVHVKKVMDLAFKKIGWQYECPLLGTEVGRRLITYVLSETFANKEELAKGLEFKASIKPTVFNVTNVGNAIRMPDPIKKGLERVIKFENEIEDFGNNYDTGTGYFTAQGNFEFTVELDVDLFVDDYGSGTTDISFELIHEYADGKRIELDKRNFPTTTELRYSAPITIVKSAKILAGEKVWVRYYARGNSGHCFIKEKSTFSCKLIHAIPKVGEVFDVQKSLRHDKVLDYWKGVDHLFNFKYYTSIAEKKVYILTPYDVNYFGDNISGFFLNTLDDFTDYIDLGSTEITVPQEEKKNLYYKFKSSSDNEIEKLKLAESKELHSKFIDNGHDFKDKTETFENPYFEPTLNSSPIGWISGQSINDIPYMIDNADSKQSFKIGPRILIAGGLKQHYLDNGKNPNIFNYYDFVFSPEIPYAYQIGEAFTSFTGPYNARVFSKDPYYLVYGNQEFDLFNLFYAKYNKEFRDCLKVNVNAQFNEDKYESINFRKRVLIPHKGTTQYGRLLSVDNFNLETGKSKLLFKADNTSEPACDVYTPEIQCKNFPDILVTSSGGGNYTISASGTNTSPVDTIVIEWKYYDDAAWTTGTTFNTLDKVVIARITWNYSDDCPTIQKTLSIQPCANYPKICFERVLPANELNIYECGTNSETPTSLLIEWSINQKDYEEVPVPFLLDEIEADEIYVRMTVYYPNCPPKVIEEQFKVKEAALDCTYDGIYAPSIVFVHTLGGVRIERIGAFHGKVAADIIWYRLVGSDNEWDLYDDNSPELLDTDSGKNWEAYRVIMFCGSVCPLHCSDIITAKTDCNGSVTMTNSISPASFELMWENPDIPMSNTWKAVLVDDSSSVIGELRAWVLQDVAGVQTEIAEKTIRYNQFNFKTEYSWSWNQGDTIDSLEISRNNAGTQTTGLLVNIGVTFLTGASNTDLKSQIENAIKAEMNLLYGAFDNVDYDLIVTIIGSGSTRSTKISFVAKKVVLSKWYGPKKGVDQLTISPSGGGTTTVNATGAEFQITQVTAPTFQYRNPCGQLLKVKLKVSTGTQFINDGSSDFDNIVLNSPIAVVPETMTALSESCSAFSFFPAVSGCSSPSYLWKKGNKYLGTGTTQVVYGSANVDLFVTCTDGCTYMAINEGI